MSRATLTLIVIAGFLVLGVAVAIPFVQGFWSQPVVEARNRVVRLDTVAPDAFVEVEWAGRPVVIFRPGVETARALVAANDLTAGPQLAPGMLPPAFVYYRVSTYRGCELAQRRQGELGQGWPGGWIDPCHVGAWDYAGRRIKGVNGTAELPNLTAPGHRFSADGLAVELL